MALPTGFKIDGTDVTATTIFTLDERTTPGGDVGGFTIIDTDNPDENTYTYTLVDSTGADVDDDIYQIVRDDTTVLSKIVVRADVTLDFENAAYQTHDLWIKASDGTDTVIRKVTMTLNNVNEAPTDLWLHTLSAPAVAEHAASGTEIGPFSALDPDAGDSFTFSLLDDADGRFMVDATGQKLLVKDGSKIEYEKGASYQIKVEVTDAHGLTFDKVLTIGVTDVVDTIGGSAKNDRLIGTSGNDLLKGGAGNDKIYGLAGDDTLNGGAGKDMLYGGDGKDTFQFDTLPKKGQFDMVMDFKPVDDTLEFGLSALSSLSALGMKGKGHHGHGDHGHGHSKHGISLGVDKNGHLNKKFFTVGDHAKDSNDVIYYNQKNGFVYFDADGSGSRKAIELLKLKPHLKLTVDDFHFI